MPQVSQERTEWRDMGLSKRHRCWGWDCPAVDLDFLLLEYNNGHPVAIIEYKHVRAMPVNPSHSSYQAMSSLGTRAEIPVFVARYKPDSWQFEVSALNHLARKRLPNKTAMNEAEYVGFLYRLRGETVPQSVLDGLAVSQ